MSSVSFPSVGNSLYWGPPGFFYCRERRNGLNRLQAAALSRWFWLPSGQRNPFPARDAVADQPQRWLEAQRPRILRPSGSSLIVAWDRGGYSPVWPSDRTVLPPIPALTAPCAVLPG